MKQSILHLAAIIVIVLFNQCNQCSAQCTKLLDFTGAANGVGPIGDLIFDGTFLYGMTQGGGAKDMGTIFKIKPDGTGYFKLLDLAGTANGSYPNGSLISDGTFLYGMTAAGGANNRGIIFKLKPDGSGYSKLLDFDSANGSTPLGSLLSDGTFLYGMTYAGGSHGVGLIFKIKTDGSGYSKLFDFQADTSGYNIEGSLISDGTFLYGMTSAGGTNDLGTIFKIKPDGSDYSKLFDFADSIYGRFPDGSLITDGTYLYGMTDVGGKYYYGDIFKIKTDGSGYTEIFAFATVLAANPHGTLLSDGTFLYGMTTIGGTNGDGLIFKIRPDGTDYSTIFNFSDAAYGRYPNGSLISDGTCLYGMTTNGGINDYGVIFKYCLTTGITENNTETNFTVYPNPATDQLIMHIDNFEPQFLSIYDISGKKVEEEKYVRQVDVSALASGIYFVELKGADATARKKFVKI